MTLVEFTQASVDDVGALLRARTKDSSGNEVGTFNANTRPTNVQVETLLGQSFSRIQAALYTFQVPEEYVDGITGMQALLTAMLVELSYFPESVAKKNSPYPEYLALYNDQLAELKAALKANGDADGPDDDHPDALEAQPSFSYPIDAGGLVGWSTRW